MRDRPLCSPSEAGSAEPGRASAAGHNSVPLERRRFGFRGVQLFPGAGFSLERWSQVPVIRRRRGRPISPRERAEEAGRLAGVRYAEAFRKLLLT